MPGLRLFNGNRPLQPEHILIAEQVHGSGTFQQFAVTEGSMSADWSVVLGPSNACQGLYLQ
jgi:hypothetical protein